MGSSTLANGSTLLRNIEPNCYRTQNGHLYGTLSDPYLPSRHIQRARGENQALTVVKTTG